MAGLPSSEFLRGYRIFGLLLVLALALSSAGYFFFRATPRERSINLAGVAVPVPDGMKKVSGREAPSGPRDEEKIALKGNVSPSMIARFYHSVMPANDWQPDASLSAAEGGYAFTRGRQKLIIKVDEPKPDTSILTIMVNSGEVPILTG